MSDVFLAKKGLATMFESWGRDDGVVGWPGEGPRMYHTFPKVLYL